MDMNEMLCLQCGHKWKSQRKLDSPYLYKFAQCPRCHGVSVIAVEHYKEHLQYLRRLVSPEEAKRFLQLYDYVSKFGYIRNSKTRDAKFRGIMKDLAKSYERKQLLK